MTKIKNEKAAVMVTRYLKSKLIQGARWDKRGAKMGENGREQRHV